MNFIPSLINPQWLLIAGVETHHAKERRQIAEVPEGVIEGTFESEPLCSWQAEQHARGFRTAELVNSSLGWSVRNKSGMDNFSILAGVRSGELDGSFQSATDWASRWQAVEPALRSVIVLKASLPLVS